MRKQSGRDGALRDGPVQRDAAARRARWGTDWTPARSPWPCCTHSVHACCVEAEGALTIAIGLPVVVRGEFWRWICRRWVGPRTTPGGKYRCIALYRRDCLECDARAGGRRRGTDGQRTRLSWRCCCEQQLTAEEWNPIYQSINQSTFFIVA